MNVLSYVNRALSGADIKKWIINNQNLPIARSMLRYRNLVDDRLYDIDLRPNGTACGEVRRGKPNVVRHERSNDE